MKHIVLVVLAGLAACTSEKNAGIQVSVAVAQQSMPVSIPNAQGVTVHSDDIYVTVAAVDLNACTSTAARIWRWVNPLPSAFAHSESSPFHLGTPGVVRLAGARDAFTIGSIAPPPGDYCSIGIELGAADDDAVNVDQEQTIVGKTYVARGTADAVSFDTSTDAAETITLPIDRQTLDAAHLDATLTISVDTTHAYDGIDFTSATLATDLLNNLHSAWSVAVTR